ncbi:hypothetical protein [Oceanobacillus sp. CFH 90083]|uniref:hypothetical protein n=1 Tax=Oceanobacillus sp. CFH 90083 TaxID=2592336 RepID=UPI00128D1FFE|nr:hypothetical protein [Oceanobacillus sp. CFH 90083]
MMEFNSLNDFKEFNKISDNKGGEISFIFKEIFEQYQYYEFEEKEVNKLIDKLFEASKEITPTLIPYSELTNVIFANYYDNGINETSFSEVFKSRFEKHIITKFSIEKTENKLQKNDDIFTSISQHENTKLIIDKDYQNALLVIYKIIQHAELAISQKRSLYQSLKDDIDNLTDNVYSATEKYNNMMSNFISILGIFAAIMMATFGAIQGFTAIFSNENNYSLTIIIIISCFGLFGLISILFILLHSISKLMDKDLAIYYHPVTVFSKYPVYSHTLLFIFGISAATLTHYFKTNPPAYMPDFLIQNLWSISLLLGLTLTIAYFLHHIISQSNGYGYLNNHVSHYIMNLKNKTGLHRLLNILLMSIIFIILVILILLLINIFKPLPS